MKKSYLLIFLLFSFFINLALAQNGGVIPIVRCKGLECTWQNFIETLQRVIRALLVFGYWIAAIACLVGAFMIMLGGYKRAWLDTGKKVMVDALVYYVILLLAGVLFDLFLEFLRPKLFVGQ